MSIGPESAASAAAVAQTERLPPGIRAYRDAVVQASRDEACPLVSLILFGSSVTGGYSEAISDVDLILVLADGTSQDARLQLGKRVEQLEIVHGLVALSKRPQNTLEALLQKVTATLRSFFICTRGDLLSADVTRVFALSPVQGVFVDRIVLPSIIGSGTTVWGEDLLPLVAMALPPIRRLDVVKVFFYLFNQVLLIALMFPWVDSATRYAMAALKHCVHSCYFCHHLRPAPLSEEIAFFTGRIGQNRTLAQLLSLRCEYRRSFGFVLRCLPTVAGLHLRTIRDNRFPRSVVPPASVA